MISKFLKVIRLQFRKNKFILFFGVGDGGGLDVLGVPVGSVYDCGARFVTPVLTKVVNIVSH